MNYSGVSTHLTPVQQLVQLDLLVADLQVLIVHLQHLVVADVLLHLGHKVEAAVLNLLGVLHLQPALVARRAVDCSDCTTVSGQALA